MTAKIERQGNVSNLQPDQRIELFAFNLGLIEITAIGEGHGFRYFVKEVFEPKEGHPNLRHQSFICDPPRLLRISDAKGVSIVGKIVAT